MYSFANRPDTEVVDEPMYAYYLTSTGAEHPGKDEIIASQPTKLDEVKEKVLFRALEKDILFIKGMAHHYLDPDFSFITSMKNVFLIRDPKSLIRSFSKIIPHPTLRDIGIKRECEIMSYLESQKLSYVVLDAHEVLKNPEKILKTLCSRLDIPFYKSMLNWAPGPRKEDGVWSKHWYASVHQSTGFAAPTRKEESLSEHLWELYEESMPYYTALHDHALRA